MNNIKKHHTAPFIIIVSFIIDPVPVNNTGDLFAQQAVQLLEQQIIDASSTLNSLNTTKSIDSSVPLITEITDLTDD